MDKITFSRSVRFRDADMNGYTIKFELRAIDCKKKHYATLEEYHETQEVSFSGHGPESSGQCDGHINPRTEGQRMLLEMWDSYHLCGMNSGTNKQSEYLGCGEYLEDYQLFVDTFKGYDKEFRNNFNELGWKIIQSIFKFEITAEPWIQKVIADKMNGNPVLYILGDDEKKWHYGSSHKSSDYCVRCFFLAIRGLYNDRGYCYGSGWLSKPVPANIKQLINELFDQIEQEEGELTESLDPVFDMGAEDFKATPKIVNQVMDLRDCGAIEAARFIALGMSLGYTFGDLNNTFEEVDSSECLYRADGQEYYVGTDEELTAVAEDYLDNGGYDELWRDAVQAEQTELGLREWLKEVIEVDGWCSILNRWDGRHEGYKVGEEWICVSRT